jgi:hypothetical protein
MFVWMDLQPTGRSATITREWLQEGLGNLQLKSATTTPNLAQNLNITTKASVRIEEGRMATMATTSISPALSACTRALPQPYTCGTCRTPNAPPRPLPLTQPMHSETQPISNDAPAPLILVLAWFPSAANTQPIVLRRHASGLAHWMGA